MATYNLTQRTVGHKGKLISTGQRTISLGGGIDPSTLNRIQNLENKVTSQSETLEHIVKLLNELSEKKSAS
jgi:hypothetical protein